MFAGQPCLQRVFLSGQDACRVCQEQATSAPSSPQSCPDLLWGTWLRRAIEQQVVSGWEDTPDLRSTLPSMTA